jgi:hypothetical protein
MLPEFGVRLQQWHRILANLYPASLDVEEFGQVRAVDAEVEQDDPLSRYRESCREIDCDGALVHTVLVGDPRRTEDRSKLGGRHVRYHGAAFREIAPLAASRIEMASTGQSSAQEPQPVHLLESITTV